MKEVGLGEKNIKNESNEEKALQFCKKIGKRVKKYINGNNVTWIRETLLRLIFIKKKNMINQKSVKENNDKL